MASIPESEIPATVTMIGNETVIRVFRRLDLPQGSALVDFDHSDRKLQVYAMPAADADAKQTAWIAFLDRLATQPPDPDFMAERPLNTPCVEKNLFPED